MASTCAADQPPIPTRVIGNNSGWPAPEALPIFDGFRNGVCGHWWWSEFWSLFCHWGFGGHQLLYPSDHLSSYLHAELQLGETKVDVNALSALFVASGFCKSLGPEARANLAVGNLERN